MMIYANKRRYILQYRHPGNCVIDDAEGFYSRNLDVAITTGRQLKKDNPEALFWIDHMYAHSFGEVWSSTILLNNKIVEPPISKDLRESIDQFAQKLVASDLETDQGGH